MFAASAIYIYYVEHSVEAVVISEANWQADYDGIPNRPLLQVFNPLKVHWEITKASSQHLPG